MLFYMEIKCYTEVDYVFTTNTVYDNIALEKYIKNTIYSIS